jgi:hypothetical protein
MAPKAQLRGALQQPEAAVVVGLALPAAAAVAELAAKCLLYWTLREEVLLDQWCAAAQP